ncbi:MAG TPA: transcription elongation factor GreA [Bacillota bacterium]|nr:transcription elongation factor GreA [Bacillota bacterium]HOA15300.1 transcription elongation factor GreA [Bacillota bacterium]HOG53272.1 transcription elongation factor GreA [Bacillota bacterium]
MAEKEVFLTIDGLRKIEKELDFLKGEKRLMIAERIKQAREFGDITENSEYDDAKNEQAEVEQRISQLEQLLLKVKIIDESEQDTDIVSLGSTVLLKDIEYEEVERYTIVGSAEANPKENKISNESPVGRAIVGKEVGAVVEVLAPAGSIKYQIVEICN